MKSLAIFVEHLYGGGVEKVLQSILRYMDRTRYSLTLYSIREEILRDGIYPQDVEYVSLFAADVSTGKTDEKSNLLSYYEHALMFVKDENLNALKSEKNSVDSHGFTEKPLDISFI